MAVRRESVVLTLDDQFTSKMARVATSTALASKELKGLDGTRVFGDLGRDAEKAAKSVDKTSRSTDGLSKSTRSTSSEVDKFSGRLRVLADAAAIFGPALVPIGAVAVPAVAGLTAELGAAALAGATALLAFQGVGDTLKAVNTAALEPTTENLAAAREAMEQLSPAAQGFVTQLQAMQPLLKSLEGSAATGLFPGLGDALDELSTAAPQVERVLGEVGNTLGNLAKEGADALTGPGFAGFFDYVEKEAPIALAQLATAVGHVTHGLAELVQAAAPLSSDFGDGLLHAATSFDTFASGVSKTQGFQDFVAYVEQNGPRVGQAVAAIANALLQVVEASSGLGGPALRGITAIADVLAALANSPAGPAIFATASALALLSRASKAAESLSRVSKVLDNLTETSSRTTTAFSALNSAVVGLGAIEAVGSSISALQRHFDRAVPSTEALTAALLNLNTASGVSQLNGQVGDLGKAIDRLNAGGITRLSDSFAKLADSGGLAGNAIKGFLVTSGNLGGITAQEKQLREYANSVDAVDKALANIVTTGSPEQAKAAFSSLAAAQGLSKDQQGELLKLLPSYQDALTGAANKAKLAAGATDGLAGSLRGGATAASSFTTQLDHLNNVLSRRASARDYQAAIDNFTASLKTNGKGLDINTAAGRANQAALDNIASTAAKVAQSLHGADRGDFLVNARKAFVDAAEKAGLTRAAAAKLADQIHLTGQAKALPTVGLNLAAFVAGSQNVSAGLAKLTGQSADPKVNVDAGNALSVIHQVESSLFGLHDKTINVTTVTHTRGGGLNPQAHAAAGGYIRGPGTATSDSIPAYLSDGEYVMRAAAVDKYGVAMMHQVNSLQLADGGPVSRARLMLAGGGQATTTKPVDLESVVLS